MTTETSGQTKAVLRGAAVGVAILLAYFFHSSVVLAAADCSEYGSGSSCSSSATCPAGQQPIGSATNCSGICCFVAPQAPAPSPTAGGTTAPVQASQPAGVGVLVLPTCIQSGNCTLDDIVTTGANFANLLTQLSAALFFATFVYGGAMYLLSFGDKSRVDKGKKALTGAAIGMAIVLGAWTLVTYVANSLLGRKM